MKTAEEEMRRALMALRLEVDASIVDELLRRHTAAQAEARREALEAAAERVSKSARAYLEPVPGLHTRLVEAREDRAHVLFTAASEIRALKDGGK